FCAQSFLEILAFTISLIPLLIAAAQWYTRDPIAAQFNGFRTGFSAAGWVMLLASWPYVKKVNRRTRKVFSETIQSFTDGPKNNCKYLGTSNDLVSERKNMAAGENNNKNEIFRHEFGELFRIHRPALCRAAYRYTGNWHTAEDVVQDVCVEVLLRRNRGEVIKEPVAYVHAAVGHLAMGA